jgi:hypothetical protein
MNTKRRVSDLSSHKLNKKKGVILSPLNEAFGEQLKLSSWSQERMPEYLWLGLILMNYERKEGIKIVQKILFNISKIIPDFDYPKLSKIIYLSPEKQEIIYEIIKNGAGSKALSPLTIIYRNHDFPIFNQHFNLPEISFNSRLDKLLKAVDIYSFPQSNEATDLQYLSFNLMIMKNKFVISGDLKNIIGALEEYSNTDHCKEIMEKHRAFIRALTGNEFEEKNDIFCKKFWKDISMITKCAPMIVEYGKSIIEYENFINGYKNIIEHIHLTNKEKHFNDSKYDVIIGSTIYSLKIFIEMNTNSLENGIIGRLGLRTIIEVLMILKYLQKKQIEKPNVWEEYKLYGIDKYKLILLKAREIIVEDSSHINSKIIEIIVNEDKWEEFVNIDLKYFDDMKIREKFNYVGEENLYNAYDYDSNFAHGLWGAIRESSMLHCHNSAHQFHSVPDIYLEQKLPNIIHDSISVMLSLLEILKENYEIPEELLDKVGIIGGK